MCVQQFSGVDCLHIYRKLGALIDTKQEAIDWSVDLPRRQKK